MAGDWLKIEVGLPRKPEVWQMATLLGLSADDVTGKLIRVWAWFDAHTKDGHATGVTFPLIDAEAGVTGFAEAMVFVGWLEQRDRTLVAPNFERHNGETAKNRALARDRKRDSRGNGHAHVPPESRKDRDTSVTREEKRREEEKQSDGADTPAPRKSRKPKDEGQTFADWAASLGDEEAIPEDDPIFETVAQGGMPREFVVVAWAWFQKTYGAAGPRADNRQQGGRGWRQLFRSAVENNWPKLWNHSQSGEWYLTPAGVLIQRGLA